MSLETYLRAAPKAELHLHLEGSIQPQTVLKLARRNGMALPANTVEGLRDWYAFRDFPHFIEVYVAITRCLRTADDYELIVRELAEDLSRQYVRYAEVTFSPSTHGLVFGVPEATFLEGLERGRRRAKEDSGVEINWIFDIVRDSRDPSRFYEYTTRLAIENKSEGVVALGLAGLEADAGPEPYVSWFDTARAAGLHCIPHAGELAGPASVWGAVRALHAERIGHGVRSVEDPDLVRYLAEQRIPLEVCPTSNVLLKSYASLSEHPLRRLYDAGVPLTINSDDPALFNTTLTDELLTLPEAFGFSELSVEQIDEILLNAVRFSFLPEGRRKD
ncbi:MAG TPA: adenosine deaminase, partial [Chloroflexota bacterium]|nr:adenosine deaminase [Chloroflexota bacterium]